MFAPTPASVEEPLKLILDKLNRWGIAAIKMLPNFLVAFLVLVVFIFIAKGVRKVVDKTMGRATHNIALRNLVSRVLHFGVIAVGMVLALYFLGLNNTVASLLAGVGVIGLALGFAFQDIAANFISGVILAIRSPININDIVKVADHMGTVIDTNLRVTIVKTFQGQEVFIPNSKILQGAIVNYSTFGKRRIDLAVGVSYGEDLRAVKKLVLETINGMDTIIDKDKIVFCYTGFGGSSIDFEVKFWIDFTVQPNYLDAKSEAMMLIKEAFDKAGIMIPYPIRTLDFGIKGGEKLSEMMINLNREGSDNSSNSD